MPKKAKVNSRLKREKDKLRKRQSRQLLNLSPELTTPPDEPAIFVVPRRSTDGAGTAPPGNLPGSGLMGFPPKGEKPLARIQASP